MVSAIAMPDSLVQACLAVKNHDCSKKTRFYSAYTNLMYAFKYKIIGTSPARRCSTFSGWLLLCEWAFR